MTITLAKTGIRVAFVLAFAAATAVSAETPSVAVTISTDFPGANVSVIKNENNSVVLAPDLRGDKP